jgi:hypothetical protein
VLAAGVQPAIEACTCKLTTRSDFGTLATLNVKMLPLYFQTLGKLEEFLPAVPPREPVARGQRQEIWLSWDSSPRAAGLNLYRRRPVRGTWRLINPRPLHAACQAFVDRPPPGTYEYALTALDAHGWESPRSHTACAACGQRQPGLRLVAAKPPSRIGAGEDLALQVCVLSDRPVARAEVVYRQAGPRSWQRLPLRHRFRHAYAGTLPGDMLAPGSLMFYVEAADADGNRAVWPESAAAGLPWSASVV